MRPTFYLNHAIRSALELLPEKMRGLEAEAMCLAIPLQESRLFHRTQLSGPARGYSQFERGGGILGVLQHETTRTYAGDVCRCLDIEQSASGVYEAIAYNDILNAAFTRLLLWTHPKPLPLRGDVDGSWGYYLDTWRPGKPHPETWPGFYAQAWDLVAGPEDSEVTA